jgi:Fe-S cluster biogenesis protein NfuA
MSRATFTDASSSEALVEQVLTEHVRPALSTHAGSIRLVEVNGQDVHLALAGSCAACYFRRGCIAGVVRDVLIEHVGGEHTFIVDGSRG